MCSSLNLQESARQVQQATTAKRAKVLQQYASNFTAMQQQQQLAAMQNAVKLNQQVTQFTVGIGASAKVAAADNGTYEWRYK
jgi:hypothetical protein